MYAGPSEVGRQAKPGPSLSEGKRGVAPDTSCTRKCTRAQNRVFCVHVILRGGVQLGTRMLSAVMVLCVVFSCSKRLGWNKDVSFYRIPKVITNKGKDVKKISQKWCAGFFISNKES